MYHLHSHFHAPQKIRNYRQAKTAQLLRLYDYQKKNSKNINIQYFEYRSIEES